MASSSTHGGERRTMELGNTETITTLNGVNPIAIAPDGRLLVQ
jgi:hypothetical protein